MTNVASYERTSKDDADPARQRAEISEWATRVGVSVTTYQDIGGRRHEAGEISKRPAWVRLWADLLAGKFDTLVVSDTSRLGFRDEWELMVLAGQLRKLGVALIEARTGKHLNGPDIATIIGTSVDGYHHASHVRDLAINSLKQKSGYATANFAWQGGQIPWGMMVACRRPDGTDRWTVEIEQDGGRLQRYEDGTEVRHPIDYFPRDRRRGRKEEGGVREHLVLLPSRRHPERLEAVRSVFRWYLTERISATEIGLRLARLGHIPTGHADSRFTHRRVRRILESPAYIGRVLYGRRTSAQYHNLGPNGRVVQATIPAGGAKVKQRIKDEAEWQWSEPVPGFGDPVASMEDWLAAQVVPRAVGGARNPKSDRFLFSSLVYCGKCGSKCVGLHVRHGGRDRVVYRCSAYIRRVGGGGPDTGCGAMDTPQARIIPVADAWVGDQADRLEKVLGGDEYAMLANLLAERDGTSEALRAALDQVESWMATALDLVAEPIDLGDGRKRYMFPVSSEPGEAPQVYTVTLPGCESKADLLAIYGWLHHASESNARRELSRLEEEHERLFRGLLEMPTPMMRTRCQAEIEKCEAALALARAGRSGLGARVRELTARLTKQQQALSGARRELAGSLMGRKSRLYADLIARVTVHHELAPHGKRIVYKLQSIEIAGREQADNT